MPILNQMLEEQNSQGTNWTPSKVCLRVQGLGGEPLPAVGSLGHAATIMLHISLRGNPGLQAILDDHESDYLLVMPPREHQAGHMLMLQSVFPGYAHRCSTALVR